MDATWTPARPRLRLCRERAAEHLVRERADAAAHAAALTACQQRIETARRAVFAAGTGVVDASMTALEREWLALRRDPRNVASSVLRSWNAMAPQRWAGQLRWTPSDDLETELALAVALASDPEGVEHAERLAGATQRTLEPWGAPTTPTLRWQLARNPPLSAALVPLRDAVQAALAVSYGGQALGVRSMAAARGVHGVAADLLQLDWAWRALAVEGRCVPAGFAPAGRAFSSLPNPLEPLLALARLGYGLVSIDRTGVVLGAPP